MGTQSESRQEELNALIEDAHERLRQAELNEDAIGMAQVLAELSELENELDEMYLQDDFEEFGGPDDLSDDADVLASAGWGTDEDYNGYDYGDDY